MFIYYIGILKLWARSVSKDKDAFVKIRLRCRKGRFFSSYIDGFKSYEQKTADDDCREETYASFEVAAKIVPTALGSS